MSFCRGVKSAWSAHSIERMRAPTLALDLDQLGAGHGLVAHAEDDALGRVDVERKYGSRLERAQLVERHPEPGELDLDFDGNGGIGGGHGGLQGKALEGAGEGEARRREATAQLEGRGDEAPRAGQATAFGGDEGEDEHVADSKRVSVSSRHHHRADEAARLERGPGDRGVQGFGRQGGHRLEQRLEPGGREHEPRRAAHLVDARREKQRDVASGRVDALEDLASLAVERYQPGPVAGASLVELLNGRQ